MTGFTTCSVLVGVLLLTPVASAAQRFAVAECGQVIEAKTQGELLGDLDCSTHQGPAVTVAGGTLYLNGYTVTGNLDYPAGTESVVFCSASCTVTGPGTIEGSVTGFYASYDARRVKLKNLTITGSEMMGVQVSRRAILDSVTIENTFIGVSAGIKLTLLNSTVKNNSDIGALALARGIVVKDSTVTGNGSNGIAAAHGGRVQRSTITNNVLTGVSLTQRLKIKDSTITGNGWQGASAAGGVLTVKNTTVAQNGRIGIVSTVRVRAFDSFIIDNCTNPLVQSGINCADIMSCGPPKIRNTRCGTSLQCQAPGVSWGICELD